jgi:hypothetical protein
MVPVPLKHFAGKVPPGCVSPKHSQQSGQTRITDNARALATNRVTNQLSGLFEANQIMEKSSTPGGIRTPDLLLRSSRDDISSDQQ